MLLCLEDTSCQYETCRILSQPTFAGASARHPWLRPVGNTLIGLMVQVLMPVHACVFCIPCTSHIPWRAECNMLQSCHFWSGLQEYEVRSLAFHFGEIAASELWIHNIRWIPWWYISGDRVMSLSIMAAGLSFWFADFSAHHQEMLLKHSNQQILFPHWTKVVDCWRCLHCWKIQLKTLSESTLSRQSGNFGCRYKRILERCLLDQFVGLL